MAWTQLIVASLWDQVEKAGRVKTTDELFGHTGLKIVLCPPRVPQCNAFAERFVRSIKSECLSRFISFGEAHLRSAASTYVAYYNRARNHQGMENKLLTPQFLPPDGEIRCEQRLGGMLNYYYRKAA
jgi:integrase-like protein